MATKTIGIREDVYERLRARKREDESFTDLIDRLVDETSADWREGFGSLTTDDASELREIVERARASESRRLSVRQHRANERLIAVEDLDDETA
jgi:predicted CopG family antitoxin